MLNTEFYKEMLRKNRLIPFFHRDRLVCFLSFYITDDECKYVDADPWQVMEDNIHGKICYISQLLTNHDKENPKISYIVWHRFKSYIKSSFPAVSEIRWRRWDRNKNQVKIYRKEI